VREGRIKQDRNEFDDPVSKLTNLAAHRCT
jgi:hypothetical protein